MDLKSLLTTDAEMEDFEDGDVTVIIVGYVHAIVAPAIAGKRKELLFKFTLTNGSKRIEILVWGSALINKYFKEIRSTRIIKINGGHCKAVANTTYREEMKMVPFEIIIRENTSVTFLGYYMGEKTSKLQKVTFDNVHTVEGLVEITGYVRTPFALVQSQRGLMTYGLGAITNGSKKITVQIKQFDKSTLKIGDFITVQGNVKGQDSLVKILCDSMDNIKYDSKTPVMSAEDVQRGSRAVKRIRSSENTVPVHES